MKRGKKPALEIVETNVLCLQCRKKCKQTKDTILLTCPNFEGKDIQLEFKFTNKR